MRADLPALATLLLTAPLCAQQPFRLPDAWDQMDLEARWVHYRDITRVPAMAKPFVEALARRREFDLLEWIVLFDGWNGPPGSGAIPGDALRNHDAPQWIRAATWSAVHGDSHTFQSARKTLLSSASRVHGWLRKYPAAERLGLEGLLEQIREAPPVDPGDALPPLDPEGVLLPLLNAPREVVTFGDRLRAEPGIVYTHQVERGIAGVVARALFDEPWRSQMLRLARHPHPIVAHAALRAFTKFHAATVPWQELKALATDEQLAASVRELAAFAATYSDTPDAWFLAHDWIATGHPVATQQFRTRIVEIGDEFTAELFRKLELTPRERTLRDLQVKGLQTTQAKKRGDLAEVYLPQLLARAAHAERNARADYVAWALAELRVLYSTQNLLAIRNDFLQRGGADDAPQLQSVLKK